MDMFKRLTNKLRGKDEPVAEQPEAPEIALEKIIQGLDKAIEEGRAFMEEANAAKRRLATERASALKAAKDWGDRADRAVLTARDDIARDALKQKLEYEKTAANYQAQWDGQQAIVTQLDSQLQALIRKRDDAARNRSLLLVRQQAALTQQKMNQALQGAAGFDLTTASAHIDDVIGNIEAQQAAEAELNLLSTGSRLEMDLANLEAVSKVDDALDEIKNRYEPPRSLESVWLPEQPRSAPAKPKELWFSDAPDASANAPAPAAPPKRDLWFDDAPAPPPKRDIWFDDAPADAPQRPIWTPNERTLSIGANVSLSKRLPGIERFRIEAGWACRTPVAIEIGAALLASDGKAQNVIFRQQRRSEHGAVEQIETNGFAVNLALLPDIVSRIAFFAVIADNRRTFQHAASIWLRVLRDDTAEEIASYAHAESGAETVLILGELYRYKLEWKFKAVGQGFERGLAALAEHYGIEI